MVGTCGMVVENTKWTKLGLGVLGLANKIKCMATWVELSLVFQIQTGVRLAPDSLDLKSQEIVLRSLIKVRKSQNMEPLAL